MLRLLKDLLTGSGVLPSAIFRDLVQTLCIVMPICLTILLKKEEFAGLIRFIYPSKPQSSKNWTWAVSLYIPTEKLDLYIPNFLAAGKIRDIVANWLELMVKINFGKFNIPKFEIDLIYNWLVYFKPLFLINM